MFVRVKEATTQEERESVFRLRYRIYSEELGKQLPEMDHEARTLTDELDRTGIILAAVDTESGHVVGTVRVNLLDRQPLLGRLVKPLEMEAILSELGPEKVCYASAFMVDPACRGKTVASLLALAQYRTALLAGSDVASCIAELALVHVYQQLGFRAYAAPFRPSGHSGLRVPMLLCMRDAAWLEKVSSPMRHLLPASADDRGETANRLTRLFPEFGRDVVRAMEPKALWAAMAFGTPKTKASCILDALDPEARSALLGSAPVLKVSPGEWLYRTGEREKGMAVLLSGRLGVTLDEGDHPHYVAMVEAGELCGEMAELLGTARTADLRALDECDVLVLPHDLLDRIAAKDQAAALRISRQLNLLLSRRLRGMNEHLAALSRRDSRPARPLWSAAVPPDDACGVAGTPAAAKESYSIVTLEDPEKELARLEMQAECGWELELFWLRRLGLSDRATFLDVGSGPGVISCLLATAFAESKVVGVEPEPMLRQRAAARAARLGLGDRCRFLEGTGEALPLEPHSVDHSYARFLFQHIPQPVAMLKELARVTRPGGLVVVLDVDDEAVVVHPEPAGLRDFQQRAAEAQRRLGGDRHVARKMVEYMTVAGLASPQIEVAPITSRELALPMLVEAAFTFKAQTLRRSGLWLDKDGDTLSELASLPARPGAWMMVPVFFAHARGQ